MRVTVVFDKAFGEKGPTDLGDAFWLVESPSNRALAVKLHASNAYDPNSAVFRSGDEPPDEEEVSSLFRNVEEHHPAWTEIIFDGVTLTGSMTDEFEAAGWDVAPSVCGFSVSR